MTPPPVLIPAPSSHTPSSHSSGSVHPEKAVLSSLLSWVLRLQWGLSQWPPRPQMGGCRPPGSLHPHAFLSALSPLPGGPPSEGLSADNQGTDSESKRKKALRRQTGSLSSGAECQRQRQQQGRSPAAEGPCSCSRRGREGAGRGREGRGGKGKGKGGEGRGGRPGHWGGRGPCGSGLGQQRRNQWESGLAWEEV